MSKLFSSLRSCLLDTLMGYTKELLIILTSAEIPELLTTKSFIKVKNAYTKMEEGYKQLRKSPFTDKIQVLVQKRAHSFKALQLSVQSYLYSDVAEEKTAAETLIPLITEYGAEFSKASNSGSTGKIVNFIEDIKKPNYAAAVTALKEEPRVQQLLKDEASYEEMFLKSIKGEAENDEAAVASSQRSELNDSLKDLFTYIEVTAKESSDAKWATLQNNIAIHNNRIEKGETVRQAILKKKRDEKKNNQQK